jgi:hypothetical protein
VSAPKVDDGGANAALIALEQRFVEVYFLPFFFAGALVTGFFAAVVDALAIPSDSERLSSTSTVCVIASVPLVSGPDGWGVAGAMVCVVACEAPGPPLWRAQATGKNATNISSRMVFIWRDPNAEAMQFP